MKSLGLRYPTSTSGTCKRCLTTLIRCNRIPRVSHNKLLIHSSNKRRWNKIHKLISSPIKQPQTKRTGHRSYPKSLTASDRTSSSWSTLPSSKLSRISTEFSLESRVFKTSNTFPSGLPRNTNRSKVPASSTSLVTPLLRSSKRKGPPASWSSHRI